MSLTSSEMSPADFAAVTGNNNGNCFGGNGAIWIVILFLFAFCGGWGGNGWGNNGSQGAADNYVLASDFATLQRQIDSAASTLERKGDAINSGLCDGFYAQNTTMLTGFGTINQNISNGFSNAEIARANQQAALTAQLNANNITAMQNANALQAQLANCCCENREGQAQIRYDMATQSNAVQTAITNGFCQTNYNNQTNTRDIIENQNSNTRAVLDALAEQRTEALKARIAEQEQQINALQLAASRQAQNAYLVNQLRPAPVPAFPVAAPYQFGNCNGSCG